jgi:hypothetical protein
LFVFAFVVEIDCSGGRIRLANDLFHGGGMGFPSGEAPPCCDKALVSTGLALGRGRDRKM